MITDRTLAKYPPKAEYLLLILHEIQNNHPQNYLPEEELRKVAEYLNTTLAAVYGVVGYYTMFSIKPRGKYIIRVCRSPMCHALGANDVIQAIEEELEIKAGQTTQDRLFTLEPAECLGLCAGAPAMMVNGEVHENLDRAKIRAVLLDYRRRS